MLLSLHVMLLLENVYVVLEAAEGRLFLCKSFGQTVHGLMCGVLCARSGMSVQWCECKW